MFELHPRLIQDTLLLGEFSLSMVLLSKDANYPWCLLVPKREGLREIHQLTSDDRRQLIEESCALSQGMEMVFNPVKMNVAALGNVVPQLHIHHIARFENDPAWPGPVWGRLTAKEYEINELERRVERLQVKLVKSGLSFTQA